MRRLIMGWWSGLAPALKAIMILVFVVQISGITYGGVEDTPEKSIKLTLDKKEDYAVQHWHCEHSKSSVQESVAERSQSMKYDICSKSGIGGARIERTSKDWPSDIRVVLHLKGLEHCTLALDGEPVLEANVPSYEPDQNTEGEELPKVRVTWAPPFGELNATEPTPLVRFKQIRAPKCGVSKLDETKTEKCWEILVEQSLLKDKHVLEIRWIDFYR